MIDKDTQQNLTDADEVKSLLDSNGWRIIKAKFDARVLDLQNIHNLDYTTPESINIQLMARKMAVSEMAAWYLKDVVGFVEQQVSNNQLLEEKMDSFIERN